MVDVDLRMYGMHAWGYNAMRVNSVVVYAAHIRMENEATFLFFLFLRDRRRSSCCTLPGGKG